MGLKSNEFVRYARNSCCKAAALFVSIVILSMPNASIRADADAGKTAVCEAAIFADQGENGDELRDAADELIRNMNFAAWDEFFERADLSEAGSGNISSASDLIRELTRSSLAAEPDDLFDRIIAAFLSRMFENAPLVCTLLALAVLSCVTGVLFKGDGMDAPVKLILASAAALASTATFSSLAATARQCCGLISGFCELCAAPLSILLTACGCTEASAVLMPKLSLLSSWIARLISNTIIPLLLVSGVMSVIGGLGEGMKLSNAIKLIHKAVKWIMGLASVIFGSVVMIGGASALAIDGALYRSTKYAVDKLLPFGGSMVTGTIETVASSARLVKNAVGVAGIIITALIVISPLIKIAAALFAFRLASAACEPFSSDTRMNLMLDGIAETLSCMFAVCVCSAGMLFLMLGMIVSAGSAFL